LPLSRPRLHRSLGGGLKTVEQSEIPPFSQSIYDNLKEVPFEVDAIFMNTPASAEAQALLAMPFPSDFLPGARSAVDTCLRIQPSEKVTLITDQATAPIAASLAQELAANGCRWNAFVLEDLAPRPLVDMPQPVLADMETSDVSIFAVGVQRNELRSRMQMTEVVNRRHMRHAHMVNITPQIMCEGMRADFHRVDQLSQKVIEKVRRARSIRATTAAGTDIHAELNPSYKWLKTSGIISRDKWGNLPGGEIFTTPGEVNGTFVVDGVVGDYLCARYGLLEANPLTIEIRSNRITACESINRELRDEFWAYTHTDENSDRVGEFAIGTNLGVHQVIGNILQDEKFPGIHIAFGNPYGEHTGAPWTSTTHIDVVGLRFNIWVDEDQIMKEGKFLVEP
jgi:aminopeptidase